MTGQNSFIFGKEMAAAGQDSGRQQDSFPTNRFSLELVDVLLSEKCVFQLNQPTVTVGMLGGNTWNLPLESLLGPELFEVLRMRWEDEEWAQRPLLTLKFDPVTCTWRALRSYSPDPENCVLGCCITKFVLEAGVKVDIGVGTEEDLEWHDTDCFGFFSVILRDANQPQLPSTFVKRFASLPPVPLGIIASYLEPFECIHNFCPLSPSIPQKLRAVGVQWSELTLGGIQVGYNIDESRRDQVRLENLLDCLRALKLVAVGDAFKSLYLGDGRYSYGHYYRNAWSMSDGVKQQIFRAAERLIFAPKLQDLWLAASWLPFVDPTVPLPESLQTVYIGQTGCWSNDSACSDFWTLCLPRLILPPAAEVTVHRINRQDCIASEKAQYLAFPTHGVSLPNVTSVCLVTCEHFPFLPPKALPNLQKLELKCFTPEGNQNFVFNVSGLISHTLRSSFFPKLHSASLKLESQASMSDIVNALATAARRNLVGLELQVPIAGVYADEARRRDTGDQESLIPRLTDLVRPLRRFLKLERLKISFTRPVASADALESLLNFCLALLGTEISIVELDCVDCSDVWSKRVQSVSKLLQRSGKDVLLTRRAPERIKLPSSTPQHQQMNGLIDYKVIVHDHGLKLSKDVLGDGQGEDDSSDDE